MTAAAAAAEVFAAADAARLVTEDNDDADEGRGAHSDADDQADDDRVECKLFVTNKKKV